MISEDRPHQLKNLPEATFYVVRDDETGKIHVCEATWSYDMKDPSRADQIAVLQGYLDQPAARVPAARMKITALGTMQTINA